MNQVETKHFFLNDDDDEDYSIVDTADLNEMNEEQMKNVFDKPENHQSESESESNAEEEMREEDDSSSEEEDTVNDDIKEDKHWIYIAKGVKNVCKQIRKGRYFQEIRQFFQEEIHNNPQEVRNYIGKTFEQGKAQSYLRRLNFDNNRFTMKLSKQNQYVIQFDNIQSKHKSQKRYSCLLNFHEIILYYKSMKKIYVDPTIEIDSKHAHWYRHLKNHQEQDVSCYLHPEYLRRNKILEKRRQERRKKRRYFFYGNTNISKLKKKELIDFAKKHFVPLPMHGKQILKSKDELKLYLLIQLKSENLFNNNDNHSVINDDERHIIRPLKCTKKYGKCCCFKPNVIECDEEKNVKCDEPTKCKCVNCDHYFCNNHTTVEILKAHILKCGNKGNQRLTLREKQPHDGPSVKSWYDLNFKLFNSKLARLQQRCCCKSGAQLPGCCAHLGSMLWLIFWSIFSGITKALTLSERDKLIRKRLIDLTAFCQKQRKAKDDSIHWCPRCHTLQPATVKWVNCIECFKWYHRKCAKIKIDEYQEKRKNWLCEICTTWKGWTARHR